MDSRCLASWTTRSGRNFWSVKLSTLNPKTKIVFTARADNLLHLLVKKLRERVSLTFTDPKMHYCC
jgi:hypothetical protein